MILWAVIEFIILHDLRGREIEVNVAAISIIGEPPKGGLITKDANCIIDMGNRKFITVRETCSQVYKMIMDLKRTQP